jgi:hypothetical protein
MLNISILYLKGHSAAGTKTIWCKTRPHLNPDHLKDKSKTDLFTWTFETDLKNSRYGLVFANHVSWHWACTLLPKTSCNGVTFYLFY